MTPSEQPKGGETRDIRERLLRLLMRVIAIAGALAYLPSAWLSIKERFWIVLVADSAAYAYIVALAFLPRLPFKLKVASLLAISYALGVILLVITGPFGAGHFFIFAFVFLASLFGNLRAMILANVAAILTHVGFAAAAAAGLLAWPQGLDSVVIISFNFAFVSLVLSFAASFLVNGYAASSAEDKRLRESLEMMLREIEHRLKNNLQVISSIVSLRSSSSIDPAQALRDIKESLSAISAVHRLLYRREAFYIVGLKALIASLVERFAQLYERIGFRFEWSGGEAEMDGERAVSLGLFVNEVVMNAAKHAFEPGKGGTVSIEVRFDADRKLSLRIGDDGKGMARAEDGGSGLKIVHALARQLGAEMEIDEGGVRGEGLVTAGGVAYTLRMKVEPPDAASAG